MENEEKYLEALRVFREPPHASWKQLMVAISLAKLGNYPKARESFRLALKGYLEDRTWRGSSEPNQLVDTYVLAGESASLSQLSKEIVDYRSDPRGQSLVAIYASAVICLLYHQDEQVDVFVSGLLKKPRIKDTFAMGQVIRAIVDGDQSAFHDALDNLLKAHRGMAKFGGLRETPEGFLCLPAMSLSRIALERGIEVRAQSEYLSKGYLDYLVRIEDPSS